MNKLKPKHERFCREYVLDNNAGQAYVRAGYSPKGCYQSARKLLLKAHIAARVEELEEEILKKLAEKHAVTKEKILLERARIAFFNASELYDVNGAIKAPRDWGPDVGAIITSVKVTETYSGHGSDRVSTGNTTEVRLSAKDSSLTALEKMHGMYEKDNQQRNPYQHMSDEELDREITDMEAKRAKKLKLVNTRAINNLKK